MPLERILGDRSFLPFDVLLSLRSQLLRHPLPTLLAIAAVAASVALASSVEVASRSVASALERSMNAIAGATELEITAAGQGVPEGLIEAVRAVPGVRSASPAIQETFRVVRHGEPEEPLRILGLDLLYDREVRDYGVAEAGIVVRDHVRLVASRDSIVLSEAMARRLGVSEGDGVTLRSASGVHAVKVRGVLLGGLADAYGGALGIMDVFALQRLLEMGPIVHRLDVSLEPGSDRAWVAERLGEVVGEQAAVRRSALRENLVSPILAAYTFGIWAITFIGVLVALFLTYAVISIRVDRRMVEFALLRTAGMDARRATRAVVVDALILASVGTAFGLALSFTLAGQFIVMLSSASVFYQELAVEPEPFSIRAIGLGILVGIPMALLACVEPARRAGRLEPLAVLSRRTQVRGGSRARRRAAVFGLVSAAALCGAVVAADVRPDVRLGVAVLAGAAAVWAFGSALLPGLLPRLQEGLARIVPRVGVLIGASVGDRPGETGITIAIWATVIAAALGLLSSLSGLGESMDEFIGGENGRNAVMAFNLGSGGSGGERLPLPPSLVTAIEGVPGVRDAWASQSTTVMFRGEEIPIDDYDVGKLTRNGGLTAISEDPEASIAALGRGELLASDAFRKHFDLEVGDEVQLPTVAGLRSFRIGGASRSFSGPKGKLFVESAVFERWFRSPGAFSIVFWVDGPVEPVLGPVQAAAGGTPLIFRHGEAFERQARKSIERFSDLLMLPLAVVGVIGLIGLANLLVGNVVARRRDVALIRASGGTQWNAVAVVGLSGGVVALTGAVVGVGLGIGWAVVIRDAIAYFLGWSMRVPVDAGLIGTLIVTALGCALVAAIAPLLWTVRRESPALSPTD